MKTDLTEHRFDTGNVVLNYVEGPPSGPPLVLLHGGSARWQSFESIMPDLAKHWHLFAPDLRGHGLSGWVPGRYRLQDYVDDILAFLRAVVVEPAALVGHSLGGGAALLTAAQAPDRVRAVVVGDSPLDREPWRAVSDAQRAVLPAWRNIAGGRVPPERMAEAVKDLPVAVDDDRGYAPLREVVGEESGVIDWFVGNLYHNDPDMLTAFIEDVDATLAGYEMEILLPKIRCPVLLLQGDPDAGGLMTDAEVARALPLLVRPTHVQLEQIGHVLHNERKEPVLHAIEAFLTAID